MKEQGINRSYSVWQLSLANLAAVLVIIALSGCSDPAEAPTGLSSTSGGIDNIPPSAEFTFSCTNLSCSFDASASMDSDGSIVDYAWTWGVGEDTGSGMTASHDYSSSDSYTIILTVTDDNGAESSASKTAIITSAPPVAAFTTSCTDLDCDFNASSSSDDVGIVSYSWDFGDGGIDNVSAPSHPYSADGSYTVKLTVTDADSNSSSSSTDVSVSAGGGSVSPPTASFASSCPDLSCSFDASASSDSDGSIVGYSWDFGDGGIDTIVNPDHTYTLEGDYTVLLTVTDDDGLTSSSQQELSVSIPNNPPSAVFTFSCADLVCDFISTSSDTDGTIASHSWDFGDGGSDITSTPSYTYASVGSYSVQLTVTDNDGASSSASQSVTVSNSIADGQVLYNDKCSTCHGLDAQGGTLAKIDIRGKTAAQITTAINTQPQMSSLSSLTATEIQNIADYLATL